jgi:UPF0755 protein
MLLEAFAANIAPNVRADAAAKGVTFYQALIIASIVQRESRVPETQKLVASIFYNRLRDGKPPRLHRAGLVRARGRGTGGRA